MDTKNKTDALLVAPESALAELLSTSGVKASDRLQIAIYVSADTCPFGSVADLELADSLAFLASRIDGVDYTRETLSNKSAKNTISRIINNAARNANNGKSVTDAKTIIETVTQRRKVALTAKMA